MPHTIPWCLAMSWMLGTSQPRLPQRVTFFLSLPFSLSIFGINLGEDDVVDPVKAIEAVMKKALLATYEGRFDEAEGLYHDALQMLYDKASTSDDMKEHIDDDGVFLRQKAHIYCEMANLSLLANKLDDAEKLFKETMKCCLQGGMMQNDNVMIEISLKLSNLFSSQGRLHEAEVGYRFCLSGLQSQVTPDGVDEDSEAIVQNSKALVGMVAAAYGKFLHTHKASAEGRKAAVVYLRQALALAEELYGQRHANHITIANDLAVALMSNENVDPDSFHLQQQRKSNSTVGYAGAGSSTKHQRTDTAVGVYTDTDSLTTKYQRADAAVVSSDTDSSAKHQRTDAAMVYTDTDSPEKHQRIGAAVVYEDTDSAAMHRQQSRDDAEALQLLEAALSHVTYSDQQQTDESDSPLAHVPLLRCNLGEALARAGRLSEAVQACRRARREAAAVDDAVCVTKANECLAECTRRATMAAAAGVNDK